MRHTGYRDTELRAGKLDRDTRSLLSELNERPDEQFILFNLGAIAIERNDWPGALTYLTRSLERSTPTDSIKRKLYVLIARAHERLGASAAALRTCADGLALYPENAELWFLKGVVHLQRGELAQSEASFTRILGLKRPEQFCSENAGIYGHLSQCNLALLAEARGDRERAARLWRKVLVECPTDSQAKGKSGFSTVFSSSSETSKPHSSDAAMRIGDPGEVSIQTFSPIAKIDHP
jgi:tetratricopeptide (TPR) repeat protein